MSLFERIQNRRYGLQEGIDDKGNITPNPGDKNVEKSIVRNFNKKQKKYNTTNVTSSGRVKATSDILKSGSKVTTSQRQTADNVLGNLNRFFTDQSDSKTLKTKSTGDEAQFKGKPKKVTASSGAKVEFPSGSAEMGGESKKFASRNRTPSPVVTATSGSTQLTGIKDSDLESVARGQQTQAQRNLQTPKTNTVKTDQNPPTKTNTVKPDQKPVDTTNKTTNKVDKITKNLTKPKKGQEIKYNRTIDKIQTNKTPRVKRFVTKPKSITDFQGFAKRGAQRTGLTPTKPKIEVGGKLKTLSTDKVTKDILKQTPKRLKLSRALGTLGRVAGGAYAVKDFMDVARKEKALGRSKTSARLGGLSRALGGYIGGGIGATLGSGVAGLPGGIVGGGAGYHYGSKVGDKLYNIGRQYATGEKKLNVGKTFKNLRKDINANAKKLNLKNLGRLDKDKK